ncbi:protease, partial [Mesorhizobium japonicum]
MAELDGKRIALLVTNRGVEEAELARPRQAVLDAGGELVILAPQPGEVRTLVHDEDPGETFTADRA